MSRVLFNLRVVSFIVVLMLSGFSPIVLGGANVFYPDVNKPEYTGDWSVLSNWLEVKADWSGTDPATVFPINIVIRSLLGKVIKFVA